MIWVLSVLVLLLIGAVVMLWQDIGRCLKLCAGALESTDRMERRMMALEMVLGPHNDFQGAFSNERVRAIVNEEINARPYMEYTRTLKPLEERVESLEAKARVDNSLTPPH